MTSLHSLGGAGLEERLSVVPAERNLFHLELAVTLTLCWAVTLCWALTSVVLSFGRIRFGKRVHMKEGSLGFLQLSLPLLLAGAFPLLSGSGTRS